MDEIERIEERLQSLADAIPDSPEYSETYATFEALQGALLASLEGHRPSAYSPAYCVRCDAEWPCGPVVKVMGRLGISSSSSSTPEATAAGLVDRLTVISNNLGASPEGVVAGLAWLRTEVATALDESKQLVACLEKKAPKTDGAPASIGDPSLPPLVNMLASKLQSELDDGHTGELFGALRYLLDQHLPDEQGGCPVCAMTWPCWTIRSLASSFMIVLTPANIGVEAWKRIAPQMKTPEQLAEGIRHALQDVADAGLRVWTGDHDETVGIMAAVKPYNLAQVSCDGPDGTWKVYSWQAAA